MSGIRLYQKTRYKTKNTLRADAIMMLTLETTINYDVWDTIDTNATL